MKNLLALVVLTAALAAEAQGTAFTYQGQLEANGAPANGSFDLTFTLFTTNSTGTAVAGPLTNAATPVSNGLFTVTVDFGPGIFAGSNYWLELAAQTNNGPGFVTLAPRQQITAAPYAIYAPNAGTAANFTGAVALSQLPATVATNGATIIGTFNGNGAGLTNLDASGLTNGVIADALLSANVPLLAGSGPAGTNVFGANLIISNHLPDLMLIGGGGGGAQVMMDLTTFATPANLPTARIVATDETNFSSSIDLSTKAPGGAFNPLVSRVHITSGGNVGIGTLNTTNLLQIGNGGASSDGTNWYGSFIGNGGGLTNLSASEITGTLGQAQLPATVLMMTPASYTQTNIYATAGVNTVTVPAGATQMTAKLWGAAGGGSEIGTGGGGAFVQEILPVVPGQTFTVVVGQHGDATDNNGGGVESGDTPGGSRSGGEFNGGQGGQASSLFYNVSGAYITEAVAGGGGGAGYEANGGDGGNPGGNGEGGFNNSESGTAGAGGSGGIGGSAGTFGGYNGGVGGNYAAAAISTGIASTASAGGNGGNGNSTSGDGGGGGGGGYGGGGGGSEGGGGGGGSYGQTIIGGTNGVAGNDSDPNYIAPAGNGSYVNGQDGLVVLIFGNSAQANIPGTIVAPAFEGNGAALTNLNASELTGGSIPISLLPTGLASLSINNGGSLTNLQSASLVGPLIGNGSGLTNLQSTNLTGPLIGNGSGLTNLELTNVVSALATNVTYHLTGNLTGGFGAAPLYIENTNTNISCGPALRIQADGAVTPWGALSVSSQNNSAPSIIAQFGNSQAFVCTISNNGSISASGTVFANGVALTSDRNAKENFEPVDASIVLNKVAALPISEWNYKNDPTDKKHVGPMAQDFQAAFGLDGQDDKHISVVDEGGVALAAIQGLNQKIDGKNALLQSQAAEIADLKARLERIEKLLSK